MHQASAFVIALLAAGISHAATPDCNAQATGKRLTGAVKDSFVRQCEIEACDAVAAEKKLTKDAKVHFIRQCMSDKLPAGAGAQASNTAEAKCTATDLCDLSTELEATAAGSGAGPAMNSGHTFVRLKRIPKD